MTKNDFTSGPEPLEGADSLSATGMFLRAFDSESQAASQGAEDPLQASPVKPASAPQQGPGTTRVDWLIEPMSPPPSAPPSVPSAPSASKPGGPGEFTQMFQAAESRQGSTPPAFQASTPPPVAAQRPAVSPESQPAPNPSSPSASPAPGEFTRIFVNTSVPATEPRTPGNSAKTVVEPLQFTPPPANPSRMKGFSAPGVSDSASAEGSFTQFFKAAPSTPAPAPPPMQQAPAFAPPAPPPPQAHSPAKEWQPDFGSSPKPLDPGPSSPSATGLLSSLSGPGMSTAAPRQPEVTPYRPEPIPSYSSTPAPPPAEPSPLEEGSVTRLIQRISQTQREAPPEPVIPQAHTPAPPPMSSGPGEFTRIISGDTVRAAISTPPPPAPAPHAPPAPAAAFPPVPAPAPPAFHAPAAPPAPKIEPPKIAAPKLAPPALAAPKSKLEAMVPILLIINTFLLVIVLVVVIFAMKAK
jgi:hypothetical protein